MIPTMMPAQAQVARYAQDLFAAGGEGLDQFSGIEGRFAVQETGGDGNQDAVEDRCNGGIAEGHEDDDRHQRSEVEPVLLGQGPHVDFPKRHLLKTETPGIPLHHEEDGGIVEDRRNGSHDQDFQVGDPQDFGDQEGGGTQDRRGKDGSDASGSQQPAGRFPVIA